MDISIEALKLLIYLLPGFVSIKVMEWKCDTIQKEYRYFVIDALLYSLIVYAIAGILRFHFDITHPIYLFLSVVIAVVVGLIAGEAKNKEWIPYIFHEDHSYLSSHEKIFSIKAREKLFGKWHIIGFKNGKEILGILREFNTQNNEMLIEDARWVISSEEAEETLSKESGWCYIPPNQDLEYIRTIEEGQEAIA